MTASAARRIGAGAVLLLALLAGLAVHLFVPDTAVTDVSGDVLYVVAAYAALVVLAPRVPPWAAGVVAGGWSVAIELFQLTGVPLQLASAFPPAVLVLGTVFDPRDLVVYTVTAAATAGADTVMRRFARQSSRRRSR